MKIQSRSEIEIEMHKARIESGQRKIDSNNETIESLRKENVDEWELSIKLEAKINKLEQKERYLESLTVEHSQKV